MNLQSQEGSQGKPKVIALRPRRSHFSKPMTNGLADLVNRQFVARRPNQL